MRVFLTRFVWLCCELTFDISNIYISHTNKTTIFSQWCFHCRKVSLTKEYNFIQNNYKAWEFWFLYFVASLGLESIHHNCAPIAQYARQPKTCSVPRYPVNAQGAGFKFHFCHIFSDYQWLSVELSYLCAKMSEVAAHKRLFFYFRWNREIYLKSVTI